MAVSSALGRGRQEDREFKASLGYRGSLRKDSASRNLVSNTHT